MITTVSSAINQNLRLRFVMAAAVALLVFAILTVVSIDNENDELKREAVSFTRSLCISAESQQDFLLIQRELERFTTGVRVSRKVDIWTRVSWDNQAIAEAGRETRHLFRSIAQENFRTPSGRSYSAVVQIDFGEKVEVWLFRFLLAFLAACGLLLALQNIIDRGVRLALKPLMQTVQNINESAIELNNENPIYFKSPASDLMEVRELNNTIENYVSRINKYTRTLATMEQANAKLDVANQIAHDIRSPVTVLKMINPFLSGLPSDVRNAFESALTRIQGIADSLVHEAKKENDKNPRLGAHLTFNLESKIQSLVEEKRIEYKEREGLQFLMDVRTAAKGILVTCEQNELGRVFSNLINNSVEAIDTQGRISITLDKQNEFIVLSVVDNGKGIPGDLLSELGKRRVSRGKENIKSSGTGSGVFHARKFSESVGGRFSIASKPDQGTMVVLALPIAES